MADCMDLHYDSCGYSKRAFLNFRSGLAGSLANKTFYSVFQVNRKETEGKLVYNLGDLFGVDIISCFSNLLPWSIGRFFATRFSLS